MLKTIQATDLRPGDSFTFDDGDPVVYRVTSSSETEQGAYVEAEDSSGRVESHHLRMGETVIVGYTNRRAKRQRGKIRRRARKAAGKVVASC